MRELSGISRSSLDHMKAATALAFRKVQPRWQGKNRMAATHGWFLMCSSGSAWHAAAAISNSCSMHMMRQRDKWGSMAQRSTKPLQRHALLTLLIGA